MAEGFLIERLVGNGPVEREELCAAAASAGIPLRTLQRAAKDLGVRFPGKGLWELPSAPATEHPREFLSLGAGVQSTTLALLACEGKFHLDAAIFADTGWEPKAVYSHLDRLESHLGEHGIPLIRVSAGNIRDDTTSPQGRFVALPYHTLSSAGRRGIGQRQCTNEYKIRPIGMAIRQLLGATGKDLRRVPRGSAVNQWIGFSTDEIGRVNDRRDNWYTTKRYPLLELGWSRDDCSRFLREKGWEVTKSACIGCPYHSNAIWLDLKTNRPDEWADAVEFDESIRRGGRRLGRSQLDGEAFLHHSRVPLSQANLGVSGGGDPDGCSPYGCRSGDAIA